MSEYLSLHTIEMKREIAKAEELRERAKMQLHQSRLVRSTKVERERANAYNSAREVALKILDGSNVQELLPNRTTGIDPNRTHSVSIRLGDGLSLRSKALKEAKHESKTISETLNKKAEDVGVAVAKHSVLDQLVCKMKRRVLAKLESIASEEVGEFSSLSRAKTSTEQTAPKILPQLPRTRESGPEVRTVTTLQLIKPADINILSNKISDNGMTIKLGCSLSLGKDISMTLQARRINARPDKQSLISKDLDKAEGSKTDNSTFSSKISVVVHTPDPRLLSDLSRERGALLSRLHSQGIEVDDLAIELEPSEIGSFKLRRSKKKNQDEQDQGYGNVEA